MNKLEVRIIKLESMRMICLNGFGPSPETQAWSKLVAWAKAHGLWQAGQPRRFFGYNNPDPSPGSPNYGYDVWMTVDASVQADGEARLIEFPGGLYAVAHCQADRPEEDIPQAWRQLVIWRENSPYKPAHHQWLEEHISPVEAVAADPQGFRLDLYLPIAE